jgi:hypothetical protein
MDRRRYRFQIEQHEFAPTAGHELQIGKAVEDAGKHQAEDLRVNQIGMTPTVSHSYNRAPRLLITR